MKVDDEEWLEEKKKKEIEERQREREREREKEREREISQGMFTRAVCNESLKRGHFHGSRKAVYLHRA